MDKHLTSARYQRGDSEATSMLFLVVIGLLIWWFAADNGEREGTAKYDDCREVITIAPDSYQHYYKPFTCATVKTRKGKVLEGLCVHIEYDGTFFSGGHGCKAAYIYEKKQDDLCHDPKFPRLGADDLCHP